MGLMVRERERERDMTATPRLMGGFAFLAQKCIRSRYPAFAISEMPVAEQYRMRALGSLRWSSTTQSATFVDADSFPGTKFFAYIITAA